jgi:peptidoglycan/xylan/chitin deacetylase (PgdA/CDA1 family)
MAFGHRVALTFDDGPDPATTPAILDVLRDYGVKGTFFVIGARAEQHPELIERIVSEGHTLGNHTYYHRDLTKLTPELASRELQDTQAALDDVLGEHSRISLFRPPCGAPYITQTEGLPVFQEVLRGQRLYSVMWTIDSRDWALENQPESIVNNLLQSTPEGGGVVLLHDTQPQTVEALPKVIERYSAVGLKFTGVRDLLAEKYGVDPNGIEADPEAARLSTPLQPEASDNNLLSDLNSLAECLS